MREDEHPIVFLCGRDIAALLKRRGMTDLQALTEYLTSGYPATAAVETRVDLVVPDADLVMETPLEPRDGEWPAMPATIGDSSP